MRFKIEVLKHVAGASVAIIALLCLTLSVYAGSVPNVFTSGTVAKSSEVNANFTYLGDRCWDKSGSNLYYNGGNIGIGEANPKHTLSVEGGEIAVRKSASGYGIQASEFVGFYKYGVVVHADNVVAADTTTTSSFTGYRTTSVISIRNAYPGGPALTVPDGNVGIGTITPSYPLHMGSGAYVTTGGVWTNASSREYKKDIHSLTSEDAMLAFNKLEPVSFKYKTDNEQHIGFIAEDVPDIVATKDRKGLSPMDVVALLTKVVQEQQKTIAELKDQQRIIVELKEEVRALKEKSQ